MKQLEAYPDPNEEPRHRHRRIYQLPVVRRAAHLVLLALVVARLPLALVSVALLPRALARLALTSSNRHAARGFTWLLLGLGTYSPHPHWPLRRAFATRLLQELVSISQATGLLLDPAHKSAPSTRVLPHSHEGDEARAVWVKPLLREGAGSLQGKMADMFRAGGCTTIRFPGWWWGEKRDGPYNADEGEKVILFFHGGGYLDGDGSPYSHVTAPLRRLLRTLNSGSHAADARVAHRAFAPSHRLTDETSFPGVLADAVASFRYLTVELGYAASDVVVAGNSSGGNLALALVRYLRDERPFDGHPTAAGLPSGIILYSPWIDPSCSFHEAGRSSSGRRLAECNVATPELLQTAGRRLVRRLPVGARYDEYISSVNLFRTMTQGVFSGFPRTFCAAGSLDVLIDEIHAFTHYFGGGQVAMPAPIEADGGPATGRSDREAVALAREAARARLADARARRGECSVGRTSDGKLTYVEHALAAHGYDASPLPMGETAEAARDAELAAEWLRDEVGGGAVEGGGKANSVVPAGLDPALP